MLHCLFFWEAVIIFFIEYNLLVKNSIYGFIATTLYILIFSTIIVFDTQQVKVKFLNSSLVDFLINLVMYFF